MSKYDVDYSNTIIYKIYCKDENIQDVYVGHTTNFVQRKNAHMSSCMNSNYPNHNCKLYQVIRNNGGWDNWQMMIVAFYNCKDLYQARQKEQYHYIELKATLNSVEPMKSGHIHPKKNQSNKSKDECDNDCDKDEELHILYNKTNNHKKVCYNCEPCNFTTDNKTDYERHLTRKKHILKTMPVDPEPSYISNTYTCLSCHKSFKCRTSIYKHKNICSGNHDNNSCNSSTTNVYNISSQQNNSEVTTKNQELTEANQELRKSIMLLIQQNTDFQNKILDLCNQSGFCIGR